MIFSPNDKYCVFTVVEQVILSGVCQGGRGPCTLPHVASRGGIQPGAGDGSVGGFLAFSQGSVRRAYIPPFLLFFFY